MRTSACAVLATIVLSVPFQAKADFYSFDESSEVQWQTPLQLVESAAKNATDLLKWIDHSGLQPEPQTKYNRLANFGTWIKDPSEHNCYDTRARVLIRDSQSQVEFSANSNCRVASGNWIDPYGGETVTDAKGIQIDHVVALKNAYDSGAYAWDQQHRCLYANFMGFKNHLVSASSEQNNLKSDKAPDEWMPPDESYACQHLQNWLVIKYVWGLTMSDTEAQGIEKNIKQYNCDPKIFQYASADIAQIRQFAQDHLSMCSN
jgi:hypothetical protein